MPTYCIPLPPKKREKIEILLANLADLLPGIMQCTPAMRVEAPWDMQPFLKELGAEMIPRPVITASSAVIQTETTSAADKVTKRGRRKDKAEKPENGKPPARRGRPPKKPYLLEEPAEEIEPGENALTNTDGRFSEPTVFAEDRVQNHRILTRHQQPIRGHKLG